MPRVCGLENETSDLESSVVETRFLAPESEPLHQDMESSAAHSRAGSVHIWPVPWGCGRSEKGPCRTGWGTSWCPWVRCESLQGQMNLGAQMGNAADGRSGDSNQGKSGNVGSRSTQGHSSVSNARGKGGNSRVGEIHGARETGTFTAVTGLSVARGGWDWRGIRNGDQGESGNIGTEGGGRWKHNNALKERLMLQSRSFRLRKGRQELVNRAEKTSLIHTPVSLPPHLSSSQNTSSLLPLCSPTKIATPLDPDHWRSRGSSAAEAEFWGWGWWTDNTTGEIVPCSDSRADMSKEGAVGNENSDKIQDDDGDEKFAEECGDRDTSDTSHETKTAITDTLTPKINRSSKIADPHVRASPNLLMSEIPRYVAIVNVRITRKSRTEDVKGDLAPRQNVRMIFPGRCIVDGGVFVPGRHRGEFTSVYI